MCLRADVARLAAAELWMWPARACGRLPGGSGVSVRYGRGREARASAAPPRGIAPRAAAVLERWRTSAGSAPEAEEALSSEEVVCTGIPVPSTHSLLIYFRKRNFQSWMWIGGVHMISLQTL